MGNPGYVELTNSSLVGTYLTNSNGTSYVVNYPDRGLWAQCGQTCYWFWQDDYTLQNNVFTKLSKFCAAYYIYLVSSAFKFKYEVVSLF